MEEASREAASTGRADMSQKTAVADQDQQQNKGRPSRRDDARLDRGRGADRGADGTGCVPVGSNRKAYRPLVTCPSAAEVTR